MSIRSRILSIADTLAESGWAPETSLPAQKGTTMLRTPEERELALQCLDLAVRSGDVNVVRLAGAMLDFVVGTDRADAIEKAKAAVDALR